MTRVRNVPLRPRRRRDTGAGAGGYLAVLGSLLVVGLVAWWGLSSGGFLGTDQPEPGATPATPTAGPVVGDDQPPWLAGTSHTLPPALDLDGEVASHIMAPWVWDLVDQDWDVVVHPGVDGDGNPSLAAGQVLYLSAPDGILFRLWPLRNDRVIEVVAWDPELAVAWLARTGGTGIVPMVEFDLRTGSQDESWGDNAVPAANSVGTGVGNLAPVGVTGSGSELWVAYDESDLITGVLWREGTTFRRSVITDEIRRLRLQGYSVDAGIDAWIDLSRDLAFYRAPFKIDGRLDKEIWIRHDLTTDDYTTITPQVPAGADCEPIDDVFSEAQFDGNLLVALCRTGGSASTTFIAP